MRATRALAMALFAAACGTDAATSDAGDDPSATLAPDAGAIDASAIDASAIAVEDLAPLVDLGPCPSGMAFIPATIDLGAFCVDRWEGYVVELADGGVERAHSPFVVVDGISIRAKTAAGVFPQGYISQLQASAACAAAGKRLCAAAEFSEACRGPDASNHYPYGGTTHKAGYCNEGKGSSVAKFYGNDPNQWTYADFNDPKLNQWDGGLAPTASYPRCVSPYGVADCVGNLHEWGSDPADAKGHGRFRGGFYGDAEINGPGCLYVTSAHELSYHDYSTGFRCCAGPS